MPSAVSYCFRFEVIVFTFECDHTDISSNDRAVELVANHHLLTNINLRNTTQRPVRYKVINSFTTEGAGRRRAVSSITKQ